jgi:hypothetical protein
MFNSIALEVVIGLVLIYLLYSLLATVLSELIATILGLRARNLKEAVDRMLNDEKESKFWQRLYDSLNLMKNPKNKVVDAFYNHPEIKYLGSSGIFKMPSTFNAGSFSKTIISMLFGNDPISREAIESRLKGMYTQAEGQPKEAKTKIKLDPETAEYIHSLWQESQGDMAKFRLQLEGWFDRTMEQTTEWYKRKIQIILLVLGFFLAWFFYADTFIIVKKLSTDKDAREKMVSMANAYVENNKTLVDNTAIIDTAELKAFGQKLDSLLAVKKQLDADIARANTILGSGAWLPDTIKVVTDAKTKEITYIPPIDCASISKKKMPDQNGNMAFGTCEKWGYLFRLLYHHFFGFLITVIAISLGAPFWFDLLNKMMKLRTSKKEETGKAGSAVNSRTATVNTNPGSGAEAES